MRVSEKELLRTMREARARVDLAMRIATQAAVSVVENCTVEVERDGEQWLNLGDREIDYLDALRDELRFLELCGRLRRHPSEPKLVRLIEVES